MTTVYKCQTCGKELASTDWRYTNASDETFPNRKGIPVTEETRCDVCGLQGKPIRDNFANVDGIDLCLKCLELYRERKRQLISQLRNSTQPQDATTTNPRLSGLIEKT